MRITFKIAVSALACWVAVSSPERARAQGITGLHVATPGARANAMGGSFIAIADDASSCIANPAGLANLTRPQIYGEITSAEAALTTNFEETGRNTSPSFFSASAPVGSKLVVGGTYFEWLNFQDKSGVPPYWDLVGRSVGACVGVALSSKFRAGATLLRDHIDNGDLADPASGGSGIVGGLFQANEKVSIGVSAAKGSADASAPTRVGGGIAMRPMPRLLVSVDIVRIGSGLDITEIHGGGELAIPTGTNQFFLRAGAYHGSTSQDLVSFVGEQFDDQGATFGAGLAVGQRFQVDFAYVTQHKRAVVSAGARF